MPKKKEKLEEIKIRLTIEEKALIKAAAKSKGITMSKLILDSVIPTSKRNLDVIKHKEIIENRIIAMEREIENLKGNMNARRTQHKKSKFKSIFARKS